MDMMWPPSTSRRPARGHSKSDRIRSQALAFSISTDEVSFGRTTRSGGDADEGQPCRRAGEDGAERLPEQRGVPGEDGLADGAAPAGGRPRPADAGELPGAGRLVPQLRAPLL